MGGMRWSRWLRSSVGRGDPWWRFRVGVALVVGVLLFGTVGYVAVGLTPMSIGRRG